MTIFGAGLILIWALFLGIWLVRLPADRLYHPKPWVYFWITGRILLRLGTGVFAVLAWEETLHPSPLPFYGLIVEAGCPAAWEGASKLAQKLYRQEQRVGLVVVTTQRAFWAIPPTIDSTLFWRLFTLLQSSSIPREEKVDPLPAWRQVRPYANPLPLLFWIGRFSAEKVEYGQVLPFCEKDIRIEQIPLPSLPLPEATLYGLAFLLCGGVLLVSEACLFFLRQHLPLR